MGYALVGSRGAVKVGTSGGSCSPVYPQTPTANNLLEMRVAVAGSATLPGAPTGWSAGIQKAGTSCSASSFFKVAAGGDASPTIAAITSGVISAQICEWSGNATSSPKDQTGSAAGTTATLTVTAGAADAASGELAICVNSAFYSTAATKTLSDSLNNGTVTSTQNNATSTADHYCFSDAITTSNASADSNTASQTTNRLTGGAAVLISFKLGAQTFTQAVSATTTTSPAIVRQVGKVVAATTTTGPVLSAGKLVVKTLSAAVNTTAAITRALTRVVSVAATTTAAPVVVKQIGKVVLASTTTTPTLASGLVKVVVLAATATVTAALTTAVTLASNSPSPIPPKIHELRARIQARIERRKAATLLYTQGLISTKEFIALLK